MIPQLRTLTAFLRTRTLARRLKTRADISAWQEKRLRQWWQEAVRHIPYFRNSGKNFFTAQPLGQPLDKQSLMANFAAFNTLGLTAAEGWDIFEGRVRQKPGYYVGASTGTSGNRGLYVISDAERFEWLGVLLAKALPKFPQEAARITLILPLNSALYRAANLPGLALRFFDLHDGLETILPAVKAYKPDTVIAPPKVLRALAQSPDPPKLKRIFSGAEVLDPLDRALIEDRFGVRVREIYMATEGLMGVACEHGTLHLCEDVVRFEWEDVPDSDLKAPIITDFTRNVQAMVRYRMNDLLRLSDRRCPCGSPFQVVEAIEGRADDLITIGGTHTQLSKVLTPDILRNAIVDSDRRIHDFRLVQTGPDTLELTVAPPDASANAARALHNLLDRLGVSATIDIVERPLTTSARKLRRVEGLKKV